VQEFLGSCIFIFVKHPYDVGDRVVINNAHLTVEHISLMYSVFRQVDTGSIIQIPNIINNTAWINNFSRSKAMKERYDFSISAKTKFPAIENLKAVLQAFVSAPENKRDYQPNIDVELISVGNLKELQLRVEICQKVGLHEHNISSHCF
jgi:small-conductance mechanosensitive channel